MKRHELWEQDYREMRYMRLLSDLDLEQRFFDVFNNSTDVTFNGLLAPAGFEDLKSPSLYWLETSTHIFEEYRLRGYGWPQAVSNRMSLFSEKGFDFKKAAAAIKDVDVKPPYLVRYGSRRIISELYERGRFRLGPASSYNDPSLDVARRDDELQLVNGPQSRMRSKSDYHIYCLAAALKPRLFADFSGADAALVVRDLAKFFQRLDRAATNLPHAWEGTIGPVKYFDPLRTKLVDVVVGFWKYFRFAYQGEWRFAWFPRDSVPKLEPVFLELGGLRDISEPIFLN